MKMRTCVPLTVLVTAAATFATTSALASSSPAVTQSVLASKIQIAPVSIHAHTTPADPWGINLESRGITDGYVVDNVFDPGASTGWHSHPGPSLVLVVKGTVTNFTSDDPTCTGTAYAAGSSFVDNGGDDAHNLVNQGSVPAETIAIQLLPHGSPRKLPPAAPPCG